MAKQKETKNPGIILRMHPVHRLLVSAVLATVITWLLRGKLNGEEMLVLPWVIFSICQVTLSWIVFFKRTIPDIKRHANMDDGSAMYVFGMVLVSAFASLVSVLLLMINRDKGHEEMYLPLAIGGIIVSWLMVHTIFTVHYAHIYYDDLDDDNNRVEEGLEFHGKDEPDYIDFAYFSFVIGCTFQVSDVAISSRKIRRIALFHGLLSFVLNTFVVALTINLVAGLVK